MPLLLLFRQKTGRGSAPVPAVFRENTHFTKKLIFGGTISIEAYFLLLFCTKCQKVSGQNPVDALL